jgi:hypothetical protein
MAPHLATATIEHIGTIWRVCANGICKEHKQEWQARVFYHQMTATDALHPRGLASNMVGP